jgi:hypothetical protein
MGRGDAMSTPNHLYGKTPDKCMTVSDLIKLLISSYPPDLPVAYRLFSEQVALEPSDIEVKELCLPREDGWIQNKRADMPSQKYLLLPGN